jgi:plastocyanin
MKADNSISTSKARLRVGLAVTATLALLGLSACGSSKSGATTAETTVPTGKLQGTVGPAFVIAMSDAAGAPVESVPAGTYAITIDDRSTLLNFHLFGPGVNMATSVPGKGKTTWTVVLKPGVYNYECDPHASVMHGVLHVT